MSDSSSYSHLQARSVMSPLSERPLDLDYLELKGRRKYRPSYNILSANDYSFYTVFRGDFDTYHECKQKRDELYDVYNKKAMNATKREQHTNIVSFE